MKRGMILALVLMTAAGCSSDGKKEGKVVERTTQESVVEFDDLKAKPPAGWQEESPSGSMRMYQFKIPRVGDDVADGELTIFGQGIGGSAQDNIKRWKDQFEPPAGKKIEEVSTVEEKIIAGCKATILDVSGTFLDGGPMMRPGPKTRKTGYRMLGVVFQGPRRPYFIKFTGPAATVEANKKAFDEWLKSFK